MSLTKESDLAPCGVNRSRVDTQSMINHLAAASKALNTAQTSHEDARATARPLLAAHYNGRLTDRQSLHSALVTVAKAANSWLEAAIRYDLTADMVPGMHTQAVARATDAVAEARNQLIDCGF